MDFERTGVDLGNLKPPFKSVLRALPALRQSASKASRSHGHHVHVLGFYGCYVALQNKDHIL